MSNTNAGFIVECKSGRGRTYEHKLYIGKKVAVYLEIVNEGFPISYRKQAILCEESTVKVIGFID